MTSPDTDHPGTPRQPPAHPPRPPRRRWPELSYVTLSGPMITGLVQISDALLVWACGFVAHAYAVVPVEGWRLLFVVALNLVTILALLVMHSFGSYQLERMRSAVRAIWRPVLGCLTTALGLLAILFFLKIGAEVSRLWAGTWLLSCLACIVISRFILQRLTRRWIKDGRLARRAVIVGGGETAAQLIWSLEQTGEARILGVFDDRSEDRVEQIPGYPVLGSFDDLVTFSRRYAVDLLIVALPISADLRLLELLHKLWVLPVDIRLGAQSTMLRFTPRSYSYIGEVPFLDIFDKPLSDSHVASKWLFDKIVGSILLILLSPVMLIVALGVKCTSKGAVIFRQKRFGFNNQLIEVYKFRSMYEDSEDRNASKLVIKGDPRVTPFGRFIRKTSLDELPQLFNVVFKSNLSLVGPRPHALAAKAQDRLYQDVVDGYFARHKMKPGITGWAQIAGWRGETDTKMKIQRRVEHDLYYIDRWSIWFDAYILIMTPIALLTDSENAY